MSKTACILFHYFGEKSYVVQLAQDTVPLNLALREYDKTVLLRHAVEAGPFEVSRKAVKMASVVDLPTRENLVRYLNELGEEGYLVDLYIFSHGYPGRFISSRGTYGDSTVVSGQYLEAKVKPLRIRAVWQCNCYGASMNATWRKLGAQVTAGSRYVNFFPTRYRQFARSWVRGTPFAGALGVSETTSRFWVYFYIVKDALAQRKVWGGSLWNFWRVLGRGKAARDYFTLRWGSPEFPEGQSGAEHMIWTSEMLVEGRPLTTKHP